MAKRLMHAWLDAKSSRTGSISDRPPIERRPEGQGQNARERYAGRILKSGNANRNGILRHVQLKRPVHAVPKAQAAGPV